jgi:alkanesulfonate monooxygenase SsuD/methylene tetrahydromethanopterin reductase-like flavin-dependent oxidoreductase (luciferase family)
MRSGLFLPLFDELTDPAVVAGPCVQAEEAGWHGVFVWDNLRYREPVVDVADLWITLAAMATATERIRLGPMVTPLARRRPVKVARETATLDRLSGGRLTLGASSRPAPAATTATPTSAIASSSARSSGRTRSGRPRGRCFSRRR